MLLLVCLFDFFFNFTYASRYKPCCSRVVDAGCNRDYPRDCFVMPDELLTTESTQYSFDSLAVVRDKGDIFEDGDRRIKPRPINSIFVRVIFCSKYAHVRCLQIKTAPVSVAVLWAGAALSN